MVSTIQLDDKMLETLRKMKQEEHASSYNDLIAGLVALKLRKTKAGFLGKGKKYSREDILRDLRDENE